MRHFSTIRNLSLLVNSAIVVGAVFEALVETGLFKSQ